MRLGTKKNKYGTTVGWYLCETCGREFTVCPDPKDKPGWENCLATYCDSYDIERDFDLFFDDPYIWKKVHGVDDAQLVRKEP